MGTKPKKPNVLFIMDDQHRFDFVGYAGADLFEHPTLTDWQNAVSLSPIVLQILLYARLHAYRWQPDCNQPV